MDGTDGDDLLIGKRGTGPLVGGLGNDRYYIFDADVAVVEAVGAGTDTVRTKVSYTLAPGQEIETLLTFDGTSDVTLTGNEFNNRLLGKDGDETLIGGLGDDMLSGGLGADTMSGGDGNDRYYVENSGDQVFEAVGDGIDKVFARVNFTLAAGQEVEYLLVHKAVSTGLMLTGNEFDNRLFGGDGNDFLDGGTGQDFISGRGGDDTLTSSGDHAMIYGGDGNDTIRLDGSATATGLVDGGDGTDIVRSADLGQFAFKNVETLDTYYGFTNGSVKQLAAFDTYTADLAASDAQIQFSLRGEGGKLDFTTGIGGDNSVQIRDAGLTSAIRVTGSVNDDTLIGSDFNDTLRGGDGGDFLFGGEGNDSLVGGNGADRLNGGNGNDVITGGSGADSFIFDQPIAGGINIDRINDFQSGNDRIEINQEYYFSGLTVGSLDPDQFAIGAATGAGPQIVYNQSTGALYYDGNGAGAGEDIQFALLVSKPALTASDFLIV